MRKITAKLALVVAALSIVLCAATAQAGSARDYFGLVEKDPNTAIGFDLKKSGGKTKVVKLIASLPYSCAGTTSGGSAFASAKGSLAVKSNRTFSGKLKFDQIQLRGSAPTGGNYKVSGRLGTNGEARGTIAGQLFFPRMTMRGSEQPNRCYTGVLDWKATKGG